MYNKFIDKLNEKFIKAVHNIKKNNSNIINENYNDYDVEPEYEYESAETYFGEVYPYVQYLESLHLTPREVSIQNKNYQFLYDIHHKILSFSKQPVDESNLPSYGPVNTKNTLGSKQAIYSIQNIYKMADWQFGFLPNANNLTIPFTCHSLWEQGKIATAIPKIEKNKEIIIKEFEQRGYYPAKEIKDYVMGDGIPYIIIVFNPYQQDSITEYLHKHCTYLNHCSPKYNDEFIKANGFIPKSSSPAFKYPPRIFFNVNGFSENDYVEMMKQISSTNNDPRHDGTYIQYTLKISKIPKDIEFYADPNAIDCCYTTQRIPYDSVIDTTERHF